MTDDATADNISLQLVTDTDAPQARQARLRRACDIEVNPQHDEDDAHAKAASFSTAYSLTGEATPGRLETAPTLPKKGDNESGSHGCRHDFDGDYKGSRSSSSDGWWQYGQTPTRRSAR